MIRRFLTAVVLCLSAAACGPMTAEELASEGLASNHQSLQANAAASTQDPVPVHPATTLILVRDPTNPQAFLVVAADPSNPGDAVTSTQDPIPVKGSPGASVGTADPNGSGDPSDTAWHPGHH